MTLDFECGVDRNRLKTWFQETDDYGCTVRLEDMPDRKLGNVSLPVTKICISGSDEQVQMLYRKFELQFMSAGG